MAVQPTPNLFTILGFVIWGDLGPLTIYRSKRGKLVWLQKTWPTKPPSDKQIAWREKWKDAATAWNDLTATQRYHWDLATRRASLCMHGYNLWIYWHLTEDDSTIDTLERQTGAPCYRPP